MFSLPVILLGGIGFLTDAQCTTTPPGGDPTANKWEVVGQRWVKNYYDDGSVTVTDRETGVMWLGQASALEPASLADAGKMAAGVTAGGYSDWRLPSRSELVTFAENSSEDTVKGLRDLWYWTTEADADVINYYYVVGLGSDETAIRYSEFDFYRPVGAAEGTTFVYSYHDRNRNGVLPCRIVNTDKNEAKNGN